MNKVLSPAEIAALMGDRAMEQGDAGRSGLSASPDQSGDDVPIRLYDFEHPEPLPDHRLASLSRAAASGRSHLQDELTRFLRSPVTVSFLSVEQSTYHDYLAASESPTCIVRFRSSNGQEPWLLELNQPVAFAFIECLLGGHPAGFSSVPPRSFTEIEVRLLKRITRTILQGLAGEVVSSTSLEPTHVLSDGSLFEESVSSEAVAVVSYEVNCGPMQGLMQLCVPWKDISPLSVPGAVSRNELAERVRMAAAKVPVVATARVARFKLSAGRVAGLKPGDVLLTNVDSNAAFALEVGQQEVARAKMANSPHRKEVVIASPPGGSGQRH